MFRDRAGAMLASPATVALLIRGAAGLVERGGSVSGALDSVRSDLQTFVALLRAWMAGDYRGVATTSVVTVLAAVLYVVTPTDAIPDIVPLGGFVDDAALLSLVASRLSTEIEDFRAWQDRSGIEA